MNYKIVKLVLVFFFVLALTGKSQASILISEILADPASTIAGDANGDGVSSSTQDEFLELLNLDAQPLDLSGWLLKDALSTRHVFPAGSLIDADQFLVVFGGGSPNLPGINYQIASTGTLSLNNTSETVSLFDKNGLLIDQVIYGSLGGNDQAIAKFPEGTGTSFILHSIIPEAQGKLFSPGTTVNGQLKIASAAVVPEFPPIFYFGLGSGLLFLRRKITEFIG